MRALPSYLPTLDGLRGLAITLVFFHNCNVVENAPDLVGTLLARVAGFGWVGVQLFFVLSGFLITRNLLQSQGLSNYFQTFYIRRVLRVFPLYYAALFFFFVVLPWFNLAPQGILDDSPHQIWFWTFLSNWAQQRGMGGLSLPHFWSLAVEEQFYLLWPLVVFWSTPKKLLYLCAALAVASLLARYVMVSHAVAPMVIYTSSLGRMDALALGAAIAAGMQLPGAIEILHRHRFTLIGTMIALFLIGRIIPHAFGMTDELGQTLGYTLLALLFAMLIVLVIVSDSTPISDRFSILRSALTLKPLTQLGQLSFGIYIFHVPLHAYVGVQILSDWGWKSAPTTTQGVAYLVLLASMSIVLALVSQRFIEAPFLRLKRFFVSTPCH